MSNIIINPFQYATPAGNTDPYFSDVALLLHGDGTNGSTTFTDSSSNNEVVTVSGTAALNTTTKYFGTASMEFKGGGGANNAATVVLDGGGLSGDFTIECFAQTDGVSANSYIFGSTQQGVPNVGITSAEVLFFRFAGLTVTNTITMTIGQWYHVAAVRSGASFKLYVDGVGYDGTNSALSPNANFGIGCLSNVSTSNNWNGFIDELRITRGVARYTANFTPPTAPFPDS